MFAKVLDKAVALVDSRFLLVAFFPVIVFVAAGALLLARLDSSALSRIEMTWTGWSGPQKWTTAVAGVAALFILAYLVYVSVTPITRFFEGYFGPVAWVGELLDLGRAPSRITAKSSKRLRRSLTPPEPQADGKTPSTDNKKEDPLAYRKHPGDADHFPTRLGNSLRAAEIHPRNAYGMDSVLLWPALVAKMGDATRKSIDAARMALDFLVVISAASFTYALFAAVAIAVEHAGRVFWAFVVLGSAGVGYVSYCGAVAAARDYGDQVRTAFDLHRFALLQALRLPLPMNPPEERRLWKEVNEIVRSNEPTDWWIFEHPPAE